MKDRLVINFSTLSLWSKGMVDKAVDCYFRKGIQTEAMEEGSKYHGKWEEEIKKTKKLRVGKTTLTFNDPKPEYFIQTRYNDRWDIKGTFDCLDEPILYEFKTGKTKGLDFAGTMQIPIYFMISELVGVPLEKAILLHYDQHKNKTEFIVVWNDQEKMLGARNWVETLAPEIEQYFIEHQIPFDN